MRDIKFRVWDGKKMIDWPNFSVSVNSTEFYLADLCASLVEKGCIFQQYTGLKDMNGRVIYEGDIIKCGDKIYPVEYKIFMENGDAGFYLSLKDHMEVVGNIYENPALLSELTIGEE